MTYRVKRIDSPVGPLTMVAAGEILHGVMFGSIWGKWRERFSDAQAGDAPVLREAERQLAEYFAGRRKAFDLPLALDGTDFQNRVWRALADIPYGQTRTYKEQAAAAHSPKAVRAVGATNGVNPLCLVLPCHRVIGSDGSLTGYGGGLPAKRFLLALEKAPVS